MVMAHMNVWQHCKSMLPLYTNVLECVLKHVYFPSVEVRTQLNCIQYEPSGTIYNIVSCFPLVETFCGP